MELALFGIGLCFGVLLGMILATTKGQKIISKKNIVACFKDVTWNVQKFTYNGQTIKTVKGIDTFYEAPQIDDAIEKLQKLIDQS